MAKNDPRCLQWAKEHDSGATWAELSERYNEGATMIRKSVRGWRKALPSGVPSTLEEDDTLRFASGDEVKGDIVFEDKKAPPNDDDVQKLLDAYIQVMDAAKPLSTKQRFANVTVKGSLPIGIVHFSDQHVGSWSWAARRMMEDYRIVGETDGLYCDFVGDDYDNFIFNFAKFASVMPVDHQRRIALFLMRGVADKAIAAVAGNHLHWTKKTADIDLNEEVATKLNSVYLGHRGDVNVTVGEQTYHVHLAHLAQGRSAINKSNSGRRTSEAIGGADIIVEGDAHDPWSHQEYKGRKRQVWHRSGTYKLDDDYTDEIGFQQGHADMPMDILLPDTHKVIPYMDFRDGLLHLKALREEYHCKGA